MKEPKKSNKSPNPKRQAAGKANQAKRKGLTPEGRKKIQQSTSQFKPSRFSTGPKTPEGKLRSSRKGISRGGKHPKVSEELAAGLANIAKMMRAVRRLVGGK